MTKLCSSHWDASLKLASSPKGCRTRGTLIEPSTKRRRGRRLDRGSTCGRGARPSTNEGGGSNEAPGTARIGRRTGAPARPMCSGCSKPRGSRTRMGIRRSFIITVGVERRAQGEKRRLARKFVLRRGMVRRRAFEYGRRLSGYGSLRRRSRMDGRADRSPRVDHRPRFARLAGLPTERRGEAKRIADARLPSRDDVVRQDSEPDFQEASDAANRSERNPISLRPIACRYRGAETDDVSPFPEHARENRVDMLEVIAQVEQLIELGRR